jgi:collagen type II alpha
MGFKGKTGLSGAKGSRGLPGYIGEQGEIGGKGEPGVPGPDGPAGIPGPMGPPGKKGPGGNSGPKGYSSKNGRQGSPGPPGPPGLAGPSMLPPWIGGGLPDGATKGGEEPEPEGPLSAGEEAPPPVNPFYRVYRYYSSDKATEDVSSEELNQKNADFRERMEGLKEVVNKLEMPDGSQEYPARTCRDLHAYMKSQDKPQSSGMYWIDPNKGCTSDAIEVYCDFTNADAITTCVNPMKKMAIEKDNWSSQMLTQARKWFNEDHQLGTLEYAADHSQLTYLGYLSSKATQQVTVHCNNKVAWYDNARQNYKNGMHFMGTKNTEFSYYSVNKKLIPEVVEDGCASKQASDSKTVLNFSTNKFIRLPIVDVAPTYDSDTSAKFGIELGPVCFV